MKKKAYEVVAEMVNAGMKTSDIAEQIGVERRKVDQLRGYAVRKGVIAVDRTAQPKYKTAGDLHCNGLSHAQISKKMGIDVGCVNRLIKHARDKGYIPEFAPNHPKDGIAAGAIKSEFKKLPTEVQDAFLRRMKDYKNLSEMVMDYAHTALVEEMAKK